jgi:hypothetical protein
VAKFFVDGNGIATLCGGGLSCFNNGFTLSFDDVHCVVLSILKIDFRTLNYCC